MVYPGIVGRLTSFRGTRDGDQDGCEATRLLAYSPGAGFELDGAGGAAALSNVSFADSPVTASVAALTANITPQINANLRTVG